MIVLPTKGVIQCRQIQASPGITSIRPFTAARDIYADGAEVARGQRVLHLSGQVGICPDGTTSADFAEQCDQALVNLRAVLTAASMSPEISSS